MYGGQGRIQDFKEVSRNCLNIAPHHGWGAKKFFDSRLSKNAISRLFQGYLAMKKYLYKHCFSLKY